jgi:hypothetical protein
MTVMERRAYERLFSELQARILYGDIIYTGMVTNLSENGMFIRTRANFPVDAVFDIVVLKNGQTVKITVKVRRSGRSSAYGIGSEDHGIGVMLINPPRGYLEFVEKSRRGTPVLHK